MLEDFGWGGDEFLLGDCQDDWQVYGVDRFDERKGKRDLRDIQRRLLEEDEVDDAWDRENERDLCDIVREHEEAEDWTKDAEDFSGQDISEFDEDDNDYLNCSWEE